ncbi:MAG: polyvinylalcohol dehydrogenase [Verrucomicrobiales bacterium]|nr:polyvinylalcohol dehydrogenase [Verrucomicrobiales bacterium]|tara:strand:+ start:3765 stop:4997 length:1233 start_codon:yes stop_codon:yes gene_type:complete
MKNIQTILSITAISITINAVAIDWPQWRGPNRDGVNPEKNLLDEWPEEGPKILWRAKGVGAGYSSLAVAKGIIYTLGDLEDACYLIALNTTGKTLWKTRIGEPGGHRKYPGPRSTPTVADGKVYALGQQGDLICADAKTGKETWRVNVAKDFGGEMMSGWRWSESPLVDGGQILITPGGTQGAVVALNKDNGKEIWRCKDFRDRAGYSSLIIREFGGIRQYIQLTGESVAGIDAKTGKLLWQAPRKGRTAVVSTPIFDKGHLFVTSAYSVGCNGFKVSYDGNSFKAEQIYQHAGGAGMANHHGGVVRVGEYVYGSNGNQLSCIHLATGKVMWNERSAGKGAIVVVDNKIILRTERGPVSLVELNPKAYKEISSFEQPDRTRSRAWSHPVVSDGVLYLKDQDTLFAYDLRK